MLKYVSNSNSPYMTGSMKVQGKTVMNLDEELNKLIYKIKNRAGNEVTDAKRYENISESVRNTSDKLFCKAFGLTIEQHPTLADRHYLTLNLLAPSMETQATRTLMAGSKAEILKSLSDKDFVKFFKTNLKQMSENMQER